MLVLVLLCISRHNQEMLLALINKNGHGISYGEVERIDARWAKFQTNEERVIIPSNMIPGVPIRAAGDNFNRATESLVGKHLDIVNMVLYQYDTGNLQGTFGLELRVLTDKSKTVTDLKMCEILECSKMGGKQLQTANMDWFLACSRDHVYEPP